MGRTPALPIVLEWIGELEDSTSPALADGDDLLGAAREQFGLDALEPFAQRLIDLKDQGQIEFEDLGAKLQIEDLGRIQMASDFRRTMAAHARAAASPTQLIQIGQAAAVQIAGRDISNYVSFNELLDDAAAAVEAAEDADSATKEEAKTLIDRMRGKGAEMATGAMTGAGGALLGGIFKQLLGLP